MARARTLSQPPEGTRPATVRRRDRPALESDLYISGAGRTPRTPQEFRRGRPTAGPELLGGRSTWAGDRFVRDEVLGILGPASRCAVRRPWRSSVSVRTEPPSPETGAPCAPCPGTPSSAPRPAPRPSGPPLPPRCRPVRFRHRDGISVHLSYSTGVHPAETPDGLLAHLRSSSTARPPNCVRPRPADGARPEGAAVTTVSTAPAAAPPHTAHRQLPRAGEERTSRIA
jgi:hypothetical protein